MKKCYTVTGKGLTVLSEDVYQDKYVGKKPYTLLGQALRDIGYKEIDPLEDTTVVLLTDVGFEEHSVTYKEAESSWRVHVNTVFQPEITEIVNCTKCHPKE